MLRWKKMEVSWIGSVKNE